MSLLFKREWAGLTATELIRGRSPRTGQYVSADTAMRSSAVWACLRLRADLISTLPVDVYRKIAGIQIEAPSTPFLDDPGGDGWGVEDWLYAGQIELDRAGNNIGVITARDAMGYPAVVELQQVDRVAITGKGPKITGFRIGGQPYPPGDIWHERQFTVPGCPLGLSPIAYGAWSVGNYLSAQQFMGDWFSGGGASMPAGHLKNTKKTLLDTESRTVKDRFKATVTDRDVFVSGNDWEFTPVAITADSAQFLESLQFSVVDIARFLGVPSDLIDGTGSKASITYANITQRHLQLLVMHLGPAIIRRERKLSRALPRPRFVKLNTEAFLRMDPQTRSTMLDAQVEHRSLAPSERRALDNRSPFTEDQLGEFDRLFGKQPPPGTKVGIPK